MHFKWRSLNRQIWLATVADLVITSAILAQSASGPPAPIWSGDGDIPQAYGNRKVFLYPDYHSVIVLWPNPNGTGVTPRRLSLRNVINPEVRVRIESHLGTLLYSYQLTNSKQSQDSINTFSLVVWPDENLQISGGAWKAMKIDAGKRIGIPGAPDGTLLMWSPPEEQPLLPGTQTRFLVSTRARPGFTTFGTEHFPHLDLSSDWPQQVLDELDPVLDPKWIAQHVITLGPRYGPDEPVTKIAADYIVGIRELMNEGRVEPNSPFAREAIKYLETIPRAVPSATPDFLAMAKSPLEIEIANALHLSLQLK